MFIKPTFIIFLGALFLFGCNSHPETENNKFSHKIEHSYITPTKIIWQSENAEIVNPERLLQEGKHQASTVNENLCLMTNKAGSASILLDFGKEIHGGLELVTGIWPGNKPISVRIRFGESVAETMADIGEEFGPTNDHAVRDWNLELPWCGKIEIGNTGFRFVRIDLIENDVTLQLREVSAISVMRDIPYLGSFNSSNERLNQIWKTGAYTVHLNMQDFLWDGIKRDRLVWVGDMHPEVMTILSVFGANEVVPKSLDFIKDITPSGQWMNGISSYSMWWVILQHQYYMNTGDFDYLEKNKAYIFELLEKLESKIDENGKEILDGNRFLDWPTSQDEISVHAGLQSMMIMSFDAGKKIAKYFDENQKEKHYELIVEKLREHQPQLPTRKSPAALMALSNIVDAKSINDEMLLKDGVKDISTFYGYYVLNAMAKAGNFSEAMDLISEYWGAMLDLGATSFWEDFNIEWIEKAGRIDELSSENKVDVHSSYGDYCYKGLRHSFCHGWASGPTAWLSQYVLGVEVVEPGCKVVRINPHLGDLDWVEGTYPTPMGIIRVRHEKLENGEIKSEISLPKGIKLMK